MARSKNWVLIGLCAFTAIARLACCGRGAARRTLGDALARGFASPPASARPWVYWFWLNGNITKAGNYSRSRSHAACWDRRCVNHGGGSGRACRTRLPSLAPQWRKLFTFAASEANRLGLEINMNNDAGWCGSGGPWITPELSMQKLVWTETAIHGGGDPVHLELAAPEAVQGFYKDVAVLAYPTPKPPGSPSPTYPGQSILRPAGVRTQRPPPTQIVSAEQTIPKGGVIDLTSKYVDGNLTWTPPPGNWTILRIGHTSTGVENHPAPAEAVWDWSPTS